VWRTIAVVTVLGVLPGAAVPSGAQSPDPNPADPEAFPPFAESDPPNPLALYPRRPGAQYDDIEAAVGTPVRVSGAQISLQQAAIEAGPAPPPPSTPPAATFPGVGRLSIRAFDPVLDGDDAVLRVTLATDAAADLTCMCTAAADGASAIAFARRAAPDQAEVFFPVGARRGRFYVGCSRTIALAFSGLTGGAAARAVWGIDV
jgi:hypothetical protein